MEKMQFSLLAVQPPTTALHYSFAVANAKILTWSLLTHQDTFMIPVPIQNCYKKQ